MHNKEKILVTGTAGFIGYHTAKKFLAEGYQVVGLDNINDYYDVKLKYSRLEASGIHKDSLGDYCLKEYEEGKQAPFDSAPFDSAPFDSAQGDNHQLPTTNYQLLHPATLKTLQEDSPFQYGALYQSTTHKNYRFIRLALEDYHSLKELFEKEKFDRVVHLAAQAGVRYSLTNPFTYMDCNINGHLNIMEACRHNKVKHLVYASSSSVYGSNTKMPLSTSDNVDHPISLYAATKKANELMSHTYSHLYGLPTTGLRFFTVYGPFGRPDMALFLFTKAMLEDKAIDVYNHGEMWRDFTYVGDIVEGVFRVTFRVLPLDSARGDHAWGDTRDDHARGDARDDSARGDARGDSADGRGARDDHAWGDTRDDHARGDARGDHARGDHAWGDTRGDHAWGDTRGDHAWGDTRDDSARGDTRDDSARGDARGDFADGRGARDDHAGSNEEPNRKSNPDDYRNENRQSKIENRKSTIKPDPSNSTSALYKVYNIGNSSPVKLLDFIKAIEDKLGKKAQMNMMDMQPGDVPKTWADTTDLEADVGYKPDTSVEEGVGRFIEWYREYYKK